MLLPQAWGETPYTGCSLCETLMYMYQRNKSIRQGQPAVQPILGEECQEISPDYLLSQTLSQALYPWTRSSQHQIMCTVGFEESARRKLFIKQILCRLGPLCSLLLKYRHTQVLQIWQHPCSNDSASEEVLNSGLSEMPAQVLCQRCQGCSEKGQYAWSLYPTQDQHG